MHPGERNAAQHDDNRPFAQIPDRWAGEYQHGHNGAATKDPTPSARRERLPIWFVTQIDRRQCRGDQSWCRARRAHWRKPSRSGFIRVGLIAAAAVASEIDVERHAVEPAM